MRETIGSSSLLCGMLFYPRFNHGGTAMNDTQKELFEMARAKYELEPMEVQWVKKSLETLRDKLVRARMKEITGSEISTLRGKEINALTELMIKFN